MAKHPSSGVRAGSVLGAVAGAAIGAVAARVAYAAFRRRPPALPAKTPGMAKVLGEKTQADAKVSAEELGAAKSAERLWTRTNHRGEPVTLLEGPALVTGAGAAFALVPGLPARVRAAALLAGIGSGLLGAYDDLYGSATSKGFKGHLSALARGEVTTGAVKILGIGATGLAAAALATGGRPAGGRLARALGTLADGALIAGSANLANLFDLRPGRAVKAGLLAGGPLLAASLAPSRRTAAVLTAIPLGAAAALLPEDLGERAMLGDAGANALGALVGLAATTRLGRSGRLVTLGAVAALTLAAEKVSFTKVIAGNRVLNRLDMLGRRPVETG